MTRKYFLTGQVLNIIFTVMSFLIFGVVLFIYNPPIFAIFMAASLAYALKNYRLVED